MKIKAKAKLFLALQCEDTVFSPQGAIFRPEYSFQHCSRTTDYGLLTIVKIKVYISNSTKSGGSHPTNTIGWEKSSELCKKNEF